MIVVNEAGIYKLVLGSRKAVAEEFERWLTCDVIPSIRKFGSYPPPEITPSLPILDESPWEGIETKTVGQRFCQERLRWEAENKRSFADVPSFSKRIIMAIEDDMGGATKGNRLHIMTVAGLDTLYILTGRRTMTEPERALRDTYRNAEPQRRQAMIAQIGATLHLGRSGADDPA